MHLLYLSTVHEEFLINVGVKILFLEGPKYRLPSTIDFPKFRWEIAAPLNDFSKRWCKREKFEPDALKEWKIH